MKINILGTKVHVVVVVFGALCVLMLLGCIGVISWGGWKINQQDEAVADLGNQTKHLETKDEKLEEETENLGKKVENLNEKLEEETENLSKKVENLNETLEEETENLSKEVENLNEKSKNETERLNQINRLFLKFISYAVDGNCNSRECLLCKTGWIYFNNSCYFLSTFWMNWEQSRQFCQDKSADLVVIDSEQEQEFIYNKITRNHWLGLRSNESNWVWIDGRDNALGFWNTKYQYYYQNSYPNYFRNCSLTSYQDCSAFMSPGWNYKTSWFSTSSSDTLYPLCEQEAFKLSLN